MIIITIASPMVIIFITSYINIREHQYVAANAPVLGYIVLQAQFQLMIWNIRQAVTLTSSNDVAIRGGINFISEFNIRFISGAYIAIAKYPAQLPKRTHQAGIQTPTPRTTYIVEIAHAISGIGCDKVDIVMTDIKEGS